MRDEHLALLAGQLRKRRLDLGEQDVAHHFRLGPTSGCGQQVCEAPARIFLVTWRLHGARPAAPPTEAVDDAIARHAREPGSGLLYRLHHAIGQYQLVQRLLHDVLGIRRIGDPAPDVGEQSPTLAPDRGGDVAVLLREGQRLAERSLHLPTKTLEREKYFGGAAPGRTSV